MTPTSNGGKPATSGEVREALTRAVRLDLIGPGPGSEYADEALPGWERPSFWYLTGFLVPSGTPAAERADDDADDDYDSEVLEKAGLAEESSQQGKRAKRRFFPSSIGLSFLVRPGADSIRVNVTWGDYRRGKRDDAAGKQVDAWVRESQARTITIELGSSESRPEHTVPDSAGLKLHIAERFIPTEGLGGEIEPGTRAVSVFLVNDRPLADDPKDADETYVFQAGFSVECDLPFHPRPDLSGQRAPSWDESVAHLHYADTPAFATGHGVSADWTIDGDAWRRVRTTWIGSAEVEA